MTSVRFKSKVDGWLAAILALAPVATAVGGFASGMAVGFLPLVFILAIYGGLVFPMYYELDDEGLLVRAGLLRRRLAYASITGVTPSGNPISSPALSLDRLEVAVEGKLGALISPADKDGFLNALVARAPHLERAGDSVRTKT